MPTPWLFAPWQEDVVANVFILAHLESTGTAAPTSGGASIFGVFDGGTLLGACWAGANLVPVQLDPGLAGYVASAAHDTGRRYASIFGPAETVLASMRGSSNWVTVPTKSAPSNRYSPFPAHRLSAPILP